MVKAGMSWRNSTVHLNATSQYGLEEMFLQPRS